MISGVLLIYLICRYDMAGHLAPAPFRARSLALEEDRCRIDESSLDEHIISDCLAQMEASLESRRLPVHTECATIVERAG